MSTNLARERSGEVIVLVGTRLKCSHPDPGSYHLPQVMRSGAVTRIHGKMGHLTRLGRQISRCQIAMS